MAWKASVKADPGLIEPTEDELEEHRNNRASAIDAIREQPPGLAQRMKEVKAAKRKAEKHVWLYE